MKTYKVIYAMFTTIVGLIGFLFVANYMISNNYNICGGSVATIVFLIIFIGLRNIYEINSMMYYTLNIVLFFLSALSFWSFFSSDFSGFEATPGVTIFSYVLTITSSCHILTAFAAVADEEEK